MVVVVVLLNAGVPILYIYIAYLSLLGGFVVVTVVDVLPSARGQTRCLVDSKKLIKCFCPLTVVITICATVPDKC